MSTLRIVPLVDIRRRPDARPVGEQAVSLLAQSIAEVGHLHPVHVRAVEDGFELVTGSHRLAACQLLGHSEILVLELEGGDLHAELAMIDENLCRAELSPSDRATQTARRKAIYLQLHPETAAHVAGAHASNAVQGNAAANLSVASFARATAAVSGHDERTVRRDAERGEKVCTIALDLIRNSPLDTGAYLDKIKRLWPSDQVHAVKRDLAFERKKARQKRQERQRLGGGKRTSPARRKAPIAKMKVFERFIALVDEIEAMTVADLVAASGTRRSILGQRASGLAEFASSIMEGLAP